MAFTPKYGTPVSPQELQAIGQYAEPVETPHRVILNKKEDDRGFLTKAADAITNFTGLRQVADTFGAEIARAQAPTEQERNIISSNTPSVKETAGSAIRGIGTIAGLATAAPASLAGRVAQGAAFGYAQDVGADLQNDATAAQTVTPGLGTAVGASVPLAAAGIKKLSDLIGKTGDRIQFSVIKPTQADIKDGFNIQTVKKYNLGGSLKTTAEKTDKLIDDLSAQLNSKIKGSNASLDLNDVYDKTAKRVLGDKFQQFGSNANMDTAIDKLRQEIITVSGENGLVPLQDAQTIKRAAGHFGAWQYGRPDPDAKATEQVYNVFYNEMKKAIEKNAPEGIAEINKQISELIPVMNALIRRIPVAERNNVLSLTDVITLTGATFDPRSLGLTLANLASKSGYVGNKLSQFGEAASSGMGSETADLIGRTVRTGLQNPASNISAAQNTEKK